MRGEGNLGGYKDHRGCGGEAPSGAVTVCKGTQVEQPTAQHLLGKCQHMYRIEIDGLHVINSEIIKEVRN